MNRSVRRALTIMLGGLLGFTLGGLWGAMFGFPYPDASPAETARYQFHATVAGWVMLVSVMAFVIAVALLVRYSVTKNRRDAS